MKIRLVFDEVFKEMNVGLSHAKGAVLKSARALGMDSGGITKWRQSRKSPIQSPNTGLSEEQKQIKQLQKELKEAQLERDILKKVVSIFFRGDGKYSAL